MQANIFRERRISTILGISLLLLGIAAGVYIVRTGTSTGTQADATTMPLQVEISNITQDSFTISWITQQPATGVVAYGDSGKTEFVSRDKRDIFDKTLNEYTTHWVQIVGLSPNKQYQFYIQSDGTRYDDNGQLYQVRTASNQTGSSQTGFTAYGQVNDTTNKPAAGAIVLINGDNLSAQSTITDEQGKWSINLSAARSADLSSIISLQESQPLTIKVQRQVQENATAKILSSQLQPAPGIQLGKVYDFASLPVNNENADTTSQFNFITDLDAVNPGVSDGVTIWNPQENEAVSTTQPLFIGTGPAATTISIALVNGDNTLEGTVETDERGNWQWTATESLTPGLHTITAGYMNDDQSEFQVTRRFTVLSNDLANMPAIESTPSSNLEATPTLIAAVSPTATPTQVVTTAPTATPTTVAVGASTSITPTATQTPTATPTTRVSVTPVSEIETTETPTPTVSLPVAGNSLPTIAFVSLGAVILLFGLVLLI